MKIKRFEELDCWKKARALVNQIYVLSRKGGFEKDYGLKDQIQRAAVSAMSNIAEGFELGHNNEFIQFLYIAKGSAGEVISQPHIALDQNYISRKEFDQVYGMAIDVSKLIGAFILYLKGSTKRGKRYSNVLNTELWTRNWELLTRNFEPGTLNAKLSLPC